MYYVVSLSGGLGSAVAADRAIERFGAASIFMRFDDTLWETTQTYTFLERCVQRWGCRYRRFADGRTPMEVWEQAQIIPNAQVAPCTRALKIEPFQEWLWRVPKPVTVLYGLGWQEPQRIYKRRYWHHVNGQPHRPVGNDHLIAGVYEDFPLLWKPLEFRPLTEVVRSWGIEPPDSYALGFSHNNCSQRCPKQGIHEWRRTKAARPHEFAEMAAWELEQQAKGGARATRTILKSRVGGIARPLRLIDLDALNDDDPQQDDMSLCICGV